MNTDVLAQRLLAELRLVASDGGGRVAAVAAARWVGAYREDVATHPLVSGCDETAAVRLLVDHVRRSLLPVA